MASQNVPSNFKDLIQKLVSVRHTDILLLICKQFLKELPAFPYVIFVGGTEIIFLLKWKTARLLLSVIVVTIMTIPKIFLIRGQHSLNYSVAQRKNLDINSKKTKTNKQANEKQKQKQTEDWMDPTQILFAEDEPLVKACNERENIRELSIHIGEGHVQLSLVH